MKRVFYRLWDSPTFNTWLSYSTRALSLFVVLPLILKRFTEPEIALWYLFATVISLQGLADMGFKSTFIRIISYAVGGTQSIGQFVDPSVEENHVNLKPNWDLIGKIFSIMRKIYFALTVFLIILLTTFGSWAMIRPISETHKHSDAWISWIIIVFVSCLKFWATIYSNFLEGLNKIAIVRRWESLTSLFSIALSVISLLLFKSLLSLVVANQLGVLVDIGRNYLLCRNVERRRFLKLNLDHSFDKQLFNDIWKPAWRSGLSGFMSNGLNSITSVIYAQIGNTSNIASYLLALRLMGQLRDVSMAPFYSKIPLMAKLRSQYKIKELVKLSQKGMLVSNIVFVLGAVCIGIGGSFLLNKIGSKVAFIDQPLWILLAVTYFIHRYGAMHIQLYSTTNHIVSHIADGVSGAIFVIVTLIFIKKIDLYAIPLGMLAGYLGFYSWYAASRSLKSLNSKFWAFESKAGIYPFILLLIYLFIYTEVLK